MPRGRPLLLDDDEVARLRKAVAVSQASNLDLLEVTTLRAFILKEFGKKVSERWIYRFLDREGFGQEGGQKAYLGSKRWRRPFRGYDFNRTKGKDH